MAARLTLLEYKYARDPHPVGDFSLQFGVNWVSNAQQPDGDPTLTEVWDPEPSMVIPGNAMNPPSDAIVLFDGSNLSSWQHGDGSTAQWRVHDGAFTVAGGSGDIQTRQSFGSIQLHIEW